MSELETVNKDKSRQQKMPFPHQGEAVDDIVNTLSLSDRATAVMACGTGKTLVALWVAEKLKARSIVVFVPTLSLVKQLLQEWLESANWQMPEIMAICSDNSVIDYDAIEISKDECDFPVTTSAFEAKEFLMRKTKGIKLVIVTYHSSSVLVEAMDGFTFDFGFFDEAHRTAQPSDADFALGLLDENIPIKKRLFMTATPKHFSLRQKNADAMELYSMDNEKIYGTIAHTLSFREAVERDIICDYKVIVAAVSSSMVLAQIEDDKDAEFAAKRIALQMAIDKFKARKVITFHNTIAQACHFMEHTRKFFKDFEVEHVNGALSTKIRQCYMDAFKNKPNAILTNARCLVEGTDIPAVDMVAFMDKKSSQIDIVQAVGRAMRKHGNKKMGYVLIPLFLNQSSGESFEDAFERTGYGAVMEVINAMQEQDAAFMEAIANFKYSDFDYGLLGSRLQILGTGVNFPQLHKSIMLKIMETFCDSWDEMYMRLKVFKEENGHCIVPKSYKDKSLMMWVVNQRQSYTKNKILKDRLILLENIGFCWDPYEDGWKSNFEKLKAYKEKNGHCDVPQNYKDKSLMVWVRNQRRAHKNNKILKERLILLENIGFRWDPYEDNWNENFEKLKIFKEEHGHCIVSESYKDKSLMIWVFTQRKAYKNNQLLEKRKVLLEDIGFCWDPLQYSWQLNFEKLKKFKEKNRHCDVPQRYKDRSFGLWVSNQRDNYKKGKLSDEYKTLLEDIGFCWDPLQYSWQLNFEKLKKFKEKNGHCNVPKSYNDMSLMTWVGNQRQAYKKGKLSDEYRKLLENIGLCWDPYEDIWNENFEKLKAFKKEYGHCIVPKSYKDKSLMIWVGNQRRAHKNNKILKDRLVLLENIGFCWDPLEYLWQLNFEKLKKFKEKNGHCDVPQGAHDKKLAYWVSVQRRANNKDNISEERKALLEGIGFTWKIEKNTPKSPD